MIELALRLRAIQSSFMVYKWTMAMQFSFGFCIDPKNHKSEEEFKAIAVEGAMWPKKALTGWQGLAGSALQDRGVTSKHWNVAALIRHNASTSLIIYGNVCLGTNKLKIPPNGKETLKRTLEQNISVQGGVILCNGTLSYLNSNIFCCNCFERI